MPGLFQDQTVAITGGSAGLGLAIAEAFLRHGAYVYLLARDADRLQQAAERLRTHSRRVGILVADVTSEVQVAAAFAQVSAERGGLQVLVNAAGISDRSAILETAPEQFQRLWDLNFLGAVRCVRAASADLLAARGHVVNIGSLASKLASPYLGAYPAGKFALAAYSQQLRLELGARGLHVLLVCPGPIRRADAGQRYDGMVSHLPSGAREPGGGAKLHAIDAGELAERIVRSCHRGDLELVTPGKVRWLAAVAQLFPRWADRVILRNVRGKGGRVPTDS